jgi:penicillin-binding protein 1A
MRPRNLFFIYLALVAIPLIVGGIYAGISLNGELPSLEELENPKPELATQILAEDGEILDQFFVKRRSYLQYDSIPKAFINGLLATEDREFYNHWGLHTGRIVKAFVKNILSLRLKGEGASTLTQQLARNLYNMYLSHEKSLSRKVREAYTAIQIERTYTKNEILELFANTVYFGRGAYGIQVAAQVYFGKNAGALSVAECALLAGIIQRPFSFESAKNIERAMRRRNLVLMLMHEQGFIDDRTFENASRSKIKYAKSEETISGKGIAPHFVEMLRQQLQDDPLLQGYNLYRDGLVITTTLNAKMQRSANQAVEEHFKLFQAEFNKNWNWSKHTDVFNDVLQKAVKNHPDYTSAEANEKDAVKNRLQQDQRFLDSVRTEATRIQTGLVCIESQSGKIRAMVGSSVLGREARYSLNHAVQIRRQPGSSFKPFVYSAAMLNGVTQETMIDCGPFSFTLPDGKVWSLSARKKGEDGPVPLATALKLSMNPVAARLVTQYTSPREVVDLAKRMGIKSKLPAVPAIALGAAEVSPLEMTSAFSVFPNQGMHIEPYSILKIEDRFGNVLFDRTKQPGDVNDALDPKVANDMTNMMRNVVNSGTATKIRQFYRYEAAGKTGTTNDYADAWFVGFTPQLSCGVWVGFDDMRVKFTGWYGQGGAAAAPIWGRFMGKVYADDTYNSAMGFGSGFTGDIPTKDMLPTEMPLENITDPNDETTEQETIAQPKTTKPLLPSLQEKNSQEKNSQEKNSQEKKNEPPKPPTKQTPLPRLK